MNEEFDGIFYLYHNFMRFNMCLSFLKCTCTPKNIFDMWKGHSL